MKTLAIHTEWYEERIKGSRFLSMAMPVSSRSEVDEHLRAIRLAHPTASHHCYAYRLIHNQSLEIDNFSTDAGEPSGSAGAPILATLKRGDWVNALVIVVRYYGGTKLGIPGLISAYGDGATGAMGSGRNLDWIATKRWSLHVPFPLIDRVKGTIRKLGGSIVSEQFGDGAMMVVQLPLEKEEAFSSFARQLGGSGFRYEELGD